MRQIPTVEVKTEYFSFKGGLDIETPPLRVDPGSLLNCLNYEPDALGGYRRVGGYERYSGKPRPSDAAYELVACTLLSTPASGASLTIGAATMRFVKVVDGGMLVTGLSGTIPASTNIIAPGPTTVGQTASIPLLSGQVSAADEAQYLVDAATVYLSDIASVPGSGAVRGVHIYNGSVYAFRDNVGATACVMHKATAIGWSAVDLGEVVAFSNANVSVGEGDTLTQGGVTATVSRLFVETGSLASATNTGRMFISGRSGGNFAAGAATSTGGGALTLSGAQTAVTLPAGGRYEFDNYAFTGKADAMRMYGCNGVGPAFEFDGTTFATIDTKGTPNTPSFIKAHRNYLYLAQGSSVINSSVGIPHRFVTAEGASEIAVGDVVAGFASLAGEALGIFTRNKSQALTGASSATWSLQVIRGDVGAIPYSVQTMSDTFMFDDRGIVSISTSDQYGNFADATLSRKIQRVINASKNKIVAAYVNRERGHYKLLLSDGGTITMGVDNKRITGFTTGQVGFTPSCATSGEDGSGVERTFVGAADGFVYEMNRGSTFDGDDIESYFKVFYINSRSPEIRKRYRRMTLEMSAQLYASIRFQAEFSYGDQEIQSSVSDDFTASGAGGSWDFANWDEFFWDGQDVVRPSLSLSGTGLNIGMTFYSKTKLDHGHILAGSIIHYTPRRLQRT